MVLFVVELNCSYVDTESQLSIWFSVVGKILLTELTLEFRMN